MLNKKIIPTILASLLMATGAAQAALTGNIQIQGSVAAATAIVVNSVAGYNSLDLSASPVDLQVATVREINNTTNGYTVTLSSANAGKLKRTGGGEISYTAKYNGSAVSLTVAPVQVTNASPSNAVVNVVKPFAISYAGSSAQDMLAGTYSDTLTFTIAAN